MYGYTPSSNEFYVTLLSNNSMKRYPQNVQSSFTNYIDPPIILSPGQWFVGITEIFHNKFIPSFHTNMLSDATVVINNENFSLPVDKSFTFEPLERVKPSYEFMYIYSDLICERIIGDQRSRCLKVLPTTSKPEQMVRFGRVEYYQVDVNHLRSISLMITDEEGERINFRDSVQPIMITLHFRKKTI